MTARIRRTAKDWYTSSGSTGSVCINAAYREPYTEYGMEIVMFCAKQCLTKKALAAEAGIPYDSLLATIKGRRSGHNVKAAVAPVMARYEAAAKKQRRKGRGA